MSVVSQVKAETKSLIDQLIDRAQEVAPRSLPGILEARQLDPARFDKLANMYLGWLSKVRGDEGISQAVETFARFSTDLNMAQARYERSGSYASTSFDAVYQSHYSNDTAMDDYLWGLYLANFLWRHHFAICMFFQDRFLTQLDDHTDFVEFAPGHAGWSAWALSELPNATLRGYDISRQAIEVSRSVCKAANVIDRTEFAERDVLKISKDTAETADAVMSLCLAEHLPEPGQLFASIYNTLRPKGKAFITVALTAAQVDHVYEFRRESEVLRMCEANGLRVIEMLSSGPQRTLPKAKYLPRTVAVVAQKRTTDVY